MVDVACNRTYSSFHIVILLVLLTACVTLVFTVLFMLPLLCLQQTLCQVVLTLGQINLIKLTFVN